MREEFGLLWPGKEHAYQLALTPSTGTLQPCPEESVGWATTQHLLVEGDNLDVLKLLQAEYAERVKLIYIDPPYNTGKDFVYADNFHDGRRTNGKVRGAALDTPGRLHANWLTMIYPRLMLAQRLLRPDGAIFVSVDDTEAAHLRLVMNEIFGEEQFIGVFPWRSRTAKADVPFGVSRDVEWIVAYGNRDFLAGRTGTRSYYQSPDFADRWRLADLTKQTTKDERPNSFFTLVNPKTGEHYPANPNRTWSITAETFPDYYRRGKIVFPGDYAFLRLTRPAFRVFEAEDQAKALRKHGTEEVRMAISTYLPESVVGRTEHGSKEIRALFGAQVFPFPKPVALIQFLVEIATDKAALVLDFFAGSGTTGHAVMAQNAMDGGQRRFILVQQPEPLDARQREQKTAAEFCASIGKPPTIAEITKERLRRAAGQIQTEQPGYTGDLGFRLLKVVATDDDHR
jgi:adenine-specific DNA-methyltransferase